MRGSVKGVRFDGYVGIGVAFGRGVQDERSAVRQPGLCHAKGLHLLSRSVCIMQRGCICHPCLLYHAKRLYLR